MDDRVRPARGLQVVGLLLVGTGIALLVAAFFATEISVALVVLAAALLLLAAGIGLLRERAWGWSLALLVLVSGVVVVAARLLLTGGAEWRSLLPPLCANAILVVVLLWERPRRPPQPASAVP